MVDAPDCTLLMAGEAESEKSAKKMVKLSVAVPRLVVESAPFTVKREGFALVADSPERVKVLFEGTVVEPKAIFDGLKAQVGPPVQVRAIVSVKLGWAEARDIVKVVVVVPMFRICERVGEVRLKTGFPVPTKATLDAPLLTLSVMVRDPDRVPVLVGVKVTSKAQLPLTASVKGVEGQLLVSAKSLGVAVMLVTVKEVWPLLVMITFWAGLVTPIVSAGNTRLVGVNCTVVAPVMPVPVSVTRCGVPAALSLMAS